MSSRGLRVHLSVTQKVEKKVLQNIILFPSFTCKYSVVNRNAIVGAVFLPLSHSKWSFIRLMTNFGNYYPDIWSIFPKLFAISL